MANSREIKGRIKAIANIERITKTMQMIATARFQAALRSATDTQPYTKKIAELVGELAASCRGQQDDALTHPLLRQAPDAGRRLMLVITSNRGLCGGYNAGVLRAAAGVIKQQAGDLNLEVVGRKGAGYFRFTGTPVDAVHTDFSDKPAYEQVEQLAERFMQRFVAGDCDTVSVAFMSFQSAARQTPAVINLLPLADPSAESEAESVPAAASADYDFSPGPQKLLNELLPITVKTRLFQCFNEAVVGEHIARMVAMKNATDSAVTMGKELTRKYNRARQSAITTELSEIIGGAAALQ